jgi:plasmid stabilization system protein ParE
VTYRLHVRAPAAADVAEASEWYDRQEPGLGAEFLKAVRVQLEAIEAAPEQHPVVVSGIRRARLRRFPYSVFYFIDGALVVTIACMHARRHPRRWQVRR